VTGLSYPAAKAVLEGQGLIVDRKNKQTGEYPPDQVISQNPREGTEVDLGSTVVLTVAIPPKTVEVPDLYCMTPEEAQAALEELGLELGAKTTEESDQCAEGEIVSQDPAAGTAVVPRDEPFVNVTIASGPAPVVVGDYTCKTFNAAKNAAEKDGLSVTYGGTVPTLPQCPNPNFVADQDLDPGDQVEEGTTITLWTGELVEPTATPEP
jgi:serine/threonine-protein kinase